MTNKEIYNIAMKQSSLDSNCLPEDFKNIQNKIAISEKNSEARKYLELPVYCDLTSYGDNIVASVSPELFEIVSEYIHEIPIEHCFETPKINGLIEKLRPLNLGVCFMAEYFLPDVSAMVPIDCQYETKLLTPKDFSNLYLPEWSNALCENRKELDKVAFGAFDNGKIVGLAGASADCDTMWQIGIDVLPGYRKQGIAASLTNKLATELIKMGIVPFYCCAWSNVKSARTAIKSGFKPAWVQLTVKTNGFIEEINN